jgi:hypothetical protein
MSIVVAQLKTFLYNWAVANVPSGMPIIYLNNNSPRPTVDYVTLFLSNFVQIGRDYFEDPTSSTSGIAQMVGDREFSLTIEAYSSYPSGDPFTVLENLRTSLQTQSVLASLRANGLVYVNWQPIIDVSALIDSRIEQRASMDTNWRVAQIYTDSVGNINTVNAVGNYYYSDGDLVISEPITIPS